MTGRRAIRSALACVALLACAGGLTIWLVNRQHPSVNQAQVRVLLPAINRYLINDQQLADFGGTLDADLHPKVVCDAAILQITPDGGQWHVALQINCGEFARRKTALLEQDLGYPGIADIATLTKAGGRYQVNHLQVGPPYWDKAWVDGNFSSQAASWILSTNPPTAPDPISQAWKVFNFPAGTPAVRS